MKGSQPLRNELKFVKMDNFAMLPYDCIRKILSLTSPSDANTFSLVSSVFGHVAKCDLVWESFLPSYYLELVSRSKVSLKFSSKRDLYLRLCHSVLIDGCSKSFELEKFSGNISYILSARELSIAWIENPSNWTWKSLPESRFPEVAVLKTVSWLDVQAKINTRILSQNTTYGAYLIIKISDSAYGLDSIPAVVSLEVGKKVTKNTAYLRLSSENRKQEMQRLFYKNRMEILSSRVDVNGEGRVPRERRDGWLEIELGEFYSGGNYGYYDDEVKMSLKEVKGYQLKSGLIIEGIEVRPK